MYWFCMYLDSSEDHSDDKGISNVQISVDIHKTQCIYNIFIHLSMTFYILYKTDTTFIRKETEGGKGIQYLAWRCICLRLCVTYNHDLHFTLIFWPQGGNKYFFYIFSVSSISLYLSFDIGFLYFSHGCSNSRLCVAYPEDKFWPWILTLKEDFDIYPNFWMCVWYFWWG